MKMQLTVQLVGLLGLIGSCLALENFVQTFSNERDCFPIMIHPSAKMAKLSAKVTKYEVSPEYTDVEDRNATHIIITAFRKIYFREVKYKGIYVPILKCSDEAIIRGYCEEEDRGQSIQIDKQDGLFTIEIIKDMELHENFFTTDENGVYCVRANAPWSKSFKLDIQLEDGYEQDINSRTRNLGVIWQTIISGCPILILTFLWISWAQNHPGGFKAIPYSVKIMLINGIFTIVQDVTSLFDMLVTLIITRNLLCNSFWLWMNNFIPYQWSGNFSHDKITHFEGVKTFLGIQFLLIVIFVLDLVGSCYFEMTTTTTSYHLIRSGLEMLWRVIVFLYLCFKLFPRYYNTTKKLKDSNQFRSPIYKQFRWFFLSEYIGTPSSYFLEAVLSLVMVGGLPKISAYRDNYMIDDEHLHLEPVVFIIMGVYATLWRGYVLLKYWTPSYFHQLETYKERGE
ncbi:CYFA0S27e00694g1_1 [Cyberlindnera fabianii]|uniref:CYFA0S27e00694g1_1 n=1 Tax=Cyberlindnera fabianii TaxID=36022 RepID=A0A061BCC0_CYBFA|nr:CYFA0S27e00694g1_1 [Cyberlindnera fabianii]